MAKDVSNHFFYSLILRQYLSFSSRSFVQQDTAKSSLFIQVKQTDLLPFWKLVDVREEEKRTRLLAHLPAFIKKLTQKPEFFSAVDEQWFAILGSLSQEKWLIKTPPSLSSIRRVLGYSLNDLAQHPLQGLKRIITSGSFSKKEEGLTYIRQAERYIDCQQIELLCKWVLSRFQDACQKDSHTLSHCVEMGNIFIPLYIQSTLFRFSCFSLLSERENLADPLAKERLKTMLYQAKSECTCEAGFAKELVDLFLTVSNANGATDHLAELSFDILFKGHANIHTKIGHTLIAHAHALHILNLSNPDSLFEKMASHFTRIIRWDTYTESISQYGVEACSSLRIIIDEQNLTKQTVTFEDYSRFKDGCLKLDAWIAWFTPIFYTFIISGQFAIAAKTLLEMMFLHIKNDTLNDAAIWIQWALLLTPTDKHEALCHHLIVQCPSDQLRSFRDILGYAIIGLSAETTAEIESLFPSDSRDIFMWYNGVHFINSWAHHTRFELLKLPSSFWEMVFRAIKSNELSQSPLIHTLLDHYGKDKPETQLMDTIIRLLDEHCLRKLEHSNHYYLTLLSIAVYFRKKNLHSDLLIPYFSRVESLKSSVNMLLKLLEIPPLESSAHTRWLSCVLDKINQELSGLLFTMPPELVLYVLSDFAAMSALITQTLDGISNHIDVSWELFSKLALLSSFDRALFKSTVETISNVLKNEKIETLSTFFNQRLLIGTSAEKALIKAITHYVLHHAHAKKSVRKSQSGWSISPLFLLSEFCNEWLYTSFQFFYQSFDSDPIRQFLITLTPQLLPQLPSSHSEPVQRLFKSLKSQDQLQTELGLFWAKLLTDESSRKPSTEDIACHIYGFLAQLLLPETHRAPRVPLSIFIPALYSECRFVPAKYAEIYLTILTPFLKPKHNPILALQVITALIPNSNEAKERDIDSLADSILQLIPVVEQALSPSGSDHASWIYIEDIAIKRLLNFVYTFLLSQNPLSTTQVNHFAFPILLFTKTLIVKGKLITPPSLFKQFEPRSLMIDNDMVSDVFLDCLSSFRTLDTLLTLLEEKPQLKSKSLTKVTECFATCFNTLPDVLYALKTKNPTAYISMISMLFQLQTQAALQDFIKHHLPLFLPESIRQELPQVSDLLNEYLASKGDHSLTGRMTNRFFGECSSQLHVGFVQLHAFDFHSFQLFSHHRSQGIQGLKRSVFTQKLKYNVLLQIFTQLLSNPHYYRSAVQSELVINIHRLIQELGNQHRSDFESIIRTALAMHRFVTKKEPFLSELLYIRQLLLSHQQDFLATGLFSQDTFSLFASTLAPVEVMVQLFLILMTLYTARPDSFRDMIGTIEDTCVLVCQSALFHIIFSKDAHVNRANLSAFIEGIEQLEKQGRPIIKPVFHGTTLTQFDVETVYSLVTTDDKNILHHRLGYWLEKSGLWDTLSDEALSVTFTLFSDVYAIPFSTLALGFSSQESLQKGLTALASTNLFLALHLQLASGCKYTLPSLTKWQSDPQNYRAELTIVSLLSAGVLPQKTVAFEPLSVDLDAPINATRTAITAITLLEWATHYLLHHDDKMLHRLTIAFRELFTTQRAYASSFLPTFASQFPSVFWEIIFYHSSPLLSVFVDYLIDSDRGDLPLPYATLEVFIRHPLVKQQLHSTLFFSDSWNAAYPFSELPALIQVVAAQKTPSLLCTLTDPFRLGQTLRRLILVRDEHTLNTVISLEPPHLFETLFTAIFSDKAFIDLTAENAFDSMNVLSDKQLFQCIHHMIQASASDMSLPCNVLLQHPYFNSVYNNRSILLSRIMQAFSHINRDRFASIIHELSFRKESVTSQTLVYTFLLKETTFLLLSDILLLIHTLGFVPEPLSKPYLDQIKESFINMSLHDEIVCLSQQSAQGFRSILLLPLAPEAIRTAVKLNHLRKLSPLTKAIGRSLSTLLPLEALHFLSLYLCHDLPKKSVNALTSVLSSFYKKMQRQTGFKKVSEVDIESLRGEILDILNTPYALLESDDPIFLACLTALQHTEQSGPSVQSILDGLSSNDSDEQDATQNRQLYLDSHMAQVVLQPESRWMFLCFIEREIKEWTSILFTRLIEGWESQYSIWDRYIHASLSQKETIFSQQFLLKLADRFTATPPKDIPSHSIHLTHSVFGFLYTHCETRRPALIHWIEELLIAHSSPTDLTYFDKILQSPYLSSSDVIKLVSPLLIVKKGILATTILSKAMDTPFASALWSRFYADTKRPVLITEVCTPQSDFDIAIRPLFSDQISKASPLFLSICAPPFDELADYFEPWFKDGLYSYISSHPHFPEFGPVKLTSQQVYNDPLLHLLRNATFSKRSGILTIIAKYLLHYCEDRGVAPVWAYHLLLDCGRIFPNDLVGFSTTQDPNALFSILKDIGYLDETGLISSLWNRHILSIDRLIPLLPNPIERDMFLLQLHQLLDQRLEARQFFLDSLATHCPLFFFERPKQKARSGSRKIDPSVQAGLYPKNHPLSVLQFLSKSVLSSGYNRLIDDVFSTLFKSGYHFELSQELKTFSFEALSILLLYNERRFMDRQRVVDCLFFLNPKKPADRDHLAITMIKKLLPSLENTAMDPETKRPFYEFILNCFVTDSAFFHPILAPYSSLIQRTLNLNLSRLYDARTRTLFLIKSTNDTAATLVNNHSDFALSLLDILCTTLSLRYDYPDLFIDTCKTLHVEHADPTAYFMHLLTFIKPGQQIGRISSTAFDVFHNGADIRLFLQKYFILDSFGLLLIENIRDLPQSLQSRDACFELLRLFSTSLHTVVSNHDLLQKEAEKHWKTLAKFLQGFSQIQPIDIDSFQVACRILEDHHQLSAQDTLHFLSIRDFLKDLTAMDITHLVRSDYLMYSASIFGTDTATQTRLERFARLLPVSITQTDLLKKKISLEKATSFLTKMETQGYMSSDGTLTPYFYSTPLRLSGFDIKETRFWQDLLVSHVHAKRRGIIECLTVSQDIYALLHASSDHMSEAFIRLFSAIPRQKWQLITSILNHPKSIFSLQTQFISRLRDLSFGGWDGQFSPESLQLATKALKETQINQSDSIERLFQQFQASTKMTGLTRKQLSKLIIDISSVLTK